MIRSSANHHLLTLLDFGLAPDEIVESLDIGFRSKHRKGQVVVLEVEPNSRKIDQAIDSRLLQLFRIADARTLKDERRRKRSARYHYLLACTEDAGSRLPSPQRLGWHSLHSNRSPILDDDFVNLCVAG